MGLDALLATDVLDLDTLDFPSRRAARGDTVEPRLTILVHPDLRRVGEVASLAGMSAGRPGKLGRGEPYFASPAGGAGAPLLDPYVSRAPLRIHAVATGGVVIDGEGTRMAVALDGEPLGRPRLLSPEAVARGVVIELAERVALMFHLRAAQGVEPRAIGLVGEGPGTRGVRATVAAVADLDVPVLVLGETGTGKELVARAIHAQSGRAAGPYVRVNMAAIPASMAASELFGHDKGAFTGAATARDGFFQRADGGTLFLDEVADAPPEVQAMLLRVLETGEVQRVGAREARAVDVRVVAATDVDIGRSVAEERFRSALLHRLSAFVVELPPLRARGDDIARLFAHFLRLQLDALGLGHLVHPREPTAPAGLPSSLALDLLRYGWPGNVRELKNLALQVAVASRGEARLVWEGALARVTGAARKTPRAQKSAPAHAAHAAPSELSDEALMAALRRNAWQLGPAAAELGISRTSIYALVERHPTLRKASEIPDEELEGAWEACGRDVDALVGALEASRRGLLMRLRALGLR